MILVLCGMFYGALMFALGAWWAKPASQEAPVSLVAKSWSDPKAQPLVDLAKAAPVRRALHG